MDDALQEDLLSAQYDVLVLEVNLMLQHWAHKAENFSLLRAQTPQQHWARHYGRASPVRFKKVPLRELQHKCPPEGEDLAYETPAARMAVVLRRFFSGLMVGHLRLRRHGRVA